MARREIAIGRDHIKDYQAYRAGEISAWRRITADVAGVIRHVRENLFKLVITIHAGAVAAAFVGLARTTNDNVKPALFSYCNRCTGRWSNGGGGVDLDDQAYGGC